MKFNKKHCMTFLVGYFVIGGSIIHLIELNFFEITNAIVGIGLAIAFGFFFGREK